MHICCDKLGAIASSYFDMELLSLSLRLGRIVSLLDLELYFSKAILDMYSGSISEASLSALFDLIDVQVVWDGVQFAFHPSDNCVTAFIVRVDHFRKTICCHIHFLAIITMLELHDSRQFLLLLWIEYICKGLLGRHCGFLRASRTRLH